MATTMALNTYQLKFIELAQQVNALSFGEFTLKSGRISPYFFNAGQFATGKSLWHLAECYADKILESPITFDVIFGPAYKGIPLATAIAIILSQKTGQDIAWAFNRKEAKDHGEGGSIVGSPIRGKVLVVDDVITAGTAIKETMALLADSEGDISDVLVALDRQEVAPNQTQSAIQMIATQYHINTHAIITLDDLIAFANQDAHSQNYLPELTAYRQQYGIK